MPSYGVTLLSGGLDSTTVAAYAKDRVDNMSAITFHYGQSNAKEVDCAVRIAGIMAIEHRLLDISFLSDVAWYSALTHPDRYAAPSGRSGEEIGHCVPITYVPMRNTIFLSLATAYLESRVLHAIEVGGVAPSDVSASVYIATNALDYSGYPDCRPEFFENMRRTLNLGVCRIQAASNPYAGKSQPIVETRTRYSRKFRVNRAKGDVCCPHLTAKRDQSDRLLGSKLWTEYGVSIKVETPIIHLSKAEIAALGISLGPPLEHTWSCYVGGELPCGVCDSCILRANGFAEAGVSDPLLVRLGRG